MSDVELIEPIELIIQPLDKTTTPASTGLSGRREFMGNRQRKPDVTIDAQIAFGNVSMRTEFNSQLGPDEQAKGYCVLRYADMAAKNFQFKRGDKIIKLGQLDVEYYVMHSLGDSAAHFTASGFTLVRMFFADRNPVGS